MNDDQFQTLTRLSAIASVYAASWLVANTVLPGWSHGFVATILALAPVVLVLGVASALGFELSSGQCRAATTDGSRCSRGRPPNRDCCWQHRELHDVTLHPEGIDEKTGSVEDDLVVR